MKFRYFIWATFGPLVLAYAISYYWGDSRQAGDGPGRFASCGLVFVIFVLVGSVIEWLTTRKKRSPRDKT